MTAGTPVLVVGAGPTGLTLAAELLRRGVPCRLVDGRAAPAARSRALVLWPGALEALAGVGAADAVLAAALPLRGASYWAGTRRLAGVRFDGIGDSAYRGPVCLPQSDTERILRARVAELGGQVEWQTRLVRLEQGAESARVVLAGPAGPEETTAAWVVGCDGAHSTVRSEAGIGLVGGTYPRDYLLADGDLTGAVRRTGDAEARYQLAPGGVLVMVPLPDGRHRVFADTGADTAGGDTLALLNTLLAERAGAGLELTRPTWTSRFQVHQRMVERYRAGRVLLAGDAAHVHSPAGGQGLNTGVQDAANLGWKLATVVRDPAAEPVLDSYQAERMPVARAVLRMSHAQTRVWTAGTPLARAGRDLLLRAADRSGGLARRTVPALAQLDPDYRRSPAVAGRPDRRGPLRRPHPGGPVGRRFAEPGLVDAAGRPRPLGDLLADGRHLLLAWTGTATWPEAAALVDRTVATWPRDLTGAVVVPGALERPVTPAGAVPVLRALGPAVFERLGDRPRLLLVRPDRQLALSEPAGGATALLSLLGGLFGRTEPLLSLAPAVVPGSPYQPVA